MREIWRAWLRFIRPYLRDAAILRNRIRLRNREFSLNIGGGNWFRKEWKNLDFYTHPKFVDYACDLRENTPLPILSGRVKKIFCSHVIEHLSDDSGQFLFREVYRILKPGGIFRIVCPDSEKFMQAYHQNNDRFFQTQEISLVGEGMGRRLVNVFASYAAGDYVGGPLVGETQVRERVQALSAQDFIQWCVSLIPKDAGYIAHVNGYDFEKLKAVLASVGFQNIQRSSYRGSSDAELRHEFDFDNRPAISLFVECVKPYA